MLFEAYDTWAERGAEKDEASSLVLPGSELTGRQSAREPLEDELWPWRARLAASESHCSSWRNVALARGRR